MDAIHKAISVNNTPHIRYVINFNPVHVTGILETIGKPSHSSSPQLGVNAVHLMMKVIEAVEKVKLGDIHYWDPPSSP